MNVGGKGERGGEVTLSFSSPRVKVTVSTGTYTFQAPERMHIAPAKVRILGKRLGGQERTVAGYNFMVCFDRRRHVSLISNPTTVAVGIVCLVVVWVEDGLQE
jgi:hypothetical protein